MPITDTSATHDELVAYRQGRQEAMAQAAKIAREGCFFLKDTGISPQVERKICDRIANRIEAAI